MLRIEALTVTMGEFSLRNIDLQVDKGDYFVVLGVSGAGKSLLLETVAGIVASDSGHIFINGDEITHKKIQDRGAGLVYQDHALFPHMTVSENIAFPLRSKKTGKTSIHQTTRLLAEKMNILPLLERKPGTLSGGEQQRVALARTLALNPSVLLLDEPLASLDVQIKTDLRRLLRKINQEGMTIVHVTHDYEEAITLANKVAVLHNGQIIQTGSIHEVFQHPRSAFIANFIGIKNFFRARILSNNSKDSSSASEAQIAPGISFYLQDQELANEGFIILRAEDVLISTERAETSARNNFRGIIRDISPGVKGYEIKIDIGVSVISNITRVSSENLHLREGYRIWISFKASAVRFIQG